MSRRWQRNWHKKNLRGSCQEGEWDQVPKWSWVFKSKDSRGSVEIEPLIKYYRRRMKKKKKKKLGTQEMEEEEEEEEEAWRARKEEEQEVKEENLVV